MPKTILLTGGAGYIGSHTAYLLHTLGFKLVIVDALLHQQLFGHAWATFIHADIGSPGVLENIFATYPISAVMHFAGYIEVGESVVHPSRFYDNNVTNTLLLLSVMQKYEVKNIIFSSTCAVYGNPQYLPMDELHPFAPASPYGKTKLIIEYALQDYACAYGLRYVALRYFNAAGALPEQHLGECHKPETHVIPLLLRAAASNQPFTIFGNDYQTPDGTCIRDYVHVLDIARAHVQAFKYLQAGNRSDVFNLGTGTGCSVQQLISVAQEVCNIPIQKATAPRRVGDVEILVADNKKAGLLLGWQPECSDLKQIMRSAWEWEQRLI